MVGICLQFILLVHTEILVKYNFQMRHLWIIFQQCRGNKEKLIWFSTDSFFTSSEFSFFSFFPSSRNCLRFSLWTFGSLCPVRTKLRTHARANQRAPQTVRKKCVRDVEHSSCSASPVPWISLTQIYADEKIAKWRKEIWIEEKKTVWIFPRALFFLSQMKMWIEPKVSWPDKISNRSKSSESEWRKRFLMMGKLRLLVLVALAAGTRAKPMENGEKTKL